MKLPATLLQIYKEEFETTNITIKQLCEKYDIKTNQLKGYTKWKKEAQPIEAQPIEAQPIEAQPIEKIKTDIGKFKRLALEYAINFMKNDAKYAEIKEFKDIVSIVDTIEKSYKDTKEQGPTINIAIQNLVEKFRDDV